MKRAYLLLPPLLLASGQLLPGAERTSETFLTSRDLVPTLAFAGEARRDLGETVTGALGGKLRPPLPRTGTLPAQVHTHKHIYEIIPHIHRVPLPPCHSRHGF